MKLNNSDCSSEILKYAFKIHSKLGPGLLESSYEECLYYELRKAGLFFEKQKAVPLVYEDVHLEIGYRLDLLVERTVVVEVKAVEAINPIHIAQVLTYMKLTNVRIGLILNFHVASMKHGIRRLIL